MKQTIRICQKSAAHHVFRDLWKLIFNVYLHYFISLGLSHCQEKEKSFCKFIAQKKDTPNCVIFGLYLEGEREEMCKTDNNLHIDCVIQSREAKTRAGDATCLPSRRGKNEISSTSTQCSGYTDYSTHTVSCHTHPAHCTLEEWRGRRVGAIILSVCEFLSELMGGPWAKRGDIK